MGVQGLGVWGFGFGVSGLPPLPALGVEADEPVWGVWLGVW